MDLHESIIGPMWLADLQVRLSEGTSGIAVLADSSAVTAGDVFSEQSFAATTPIDIMADNVAFLCNAPLFQIIVIVCFMAYCSVIYYYRGYVFALMNTLKSKLFEDKILDEQGYVFTTFLNCVLSLGFAVLGIAAVKYADMLMGNQIAWLLPEWSISMLSIGVMAGVATIAAYQYLVLTSIGRITFSDSFTSRLQYLKKIIFSSYIITSAPTVLLLALNRTEAQDAVAYLFIVQTAMMMIFLLYKTYILFIEQNVSILHWFLYLCTVEIFPISIFVLIMVKNT